MSALKTVVFKNSRRWLMAILILALLMRLAVVFLFFGDYRPIDDALQWHQAAETFLNGRGLIIDEHLKAARVPIPGLYFAAVYAVFGFSVRAVQVANIFLGVCTVWFVYDLVRRIFGTIPARWSAFFTAFYPLLLHHTGHLFSETPVLMLIALALWLIWLLRNRAAIWFAPVGIVLGLVVLTRPNMPLTAILIALWTVIGRRAEGWLQRLAPALVILAMLVMTITPWAVRNYMLLGEFVPLTSQGGYNLWEANNPMADGRGVGGKVLFIPQIEALPEVERGVAYQRLALQFIREDLGRFARLSLRRLRYFWHLGYHGEGLAEVAFLAVYLPMLGLAIIGVWLGWRLNRDAVLLFLTVPISLAVVHMVFMPVGRYRLPAELVICMLAGVGAAWTFGKLALSTSDLSENNNAGRLRTHGSADS
jgi:4-amino-4-deoxy-L-arabinose transferase-like glycosyltransferase